MADNEGTFHIGPFEEKGFRTGKTLDSLSLMLWCHQMFVHHVIHFRSPLTAYAPFAEIRGREARWAQRPEAQKRSPARPSDDPACRLPAS